MHQIVEVVSLKTTNVNLMVALEERKINIVRNVDLIRSEFPPAD